MSMIIHHEESYLLSLDAAALERERAATLEAIPALEAFTIQTDSDAINANGLVKMALDAIASLEARRTALTKPLDAQKAEIQRAFVPVREAHERVRDIVKAKIGAYELAKKRAEEEKMRAAAAAMAEGDRETAALAVASMVPSVTPRGQTVRATWRARVVDESAVPREYMSVDQKKLASAVPKRGAPPAIPGVVWEECADVRVRR